jgi:hypothetical protein
LSDPDPSFSITITVALTTILTAILMIGFNLSYLHFVYFLVAFIPTPCPALEPQPNSHDRFCNALAGFISPFRNYFGRDREQLKQLPPLTAIRAFSSRYTCVQVLREQRLPEHTRN